MNPNIVHGSTKKIKSKRVSNISAITQKSNKDTISSQSKLNPKLRGSSKTNVDLASFEVSLKDVDIIPENNN